MIVMGKRILDRMEELDMLSKQFENATGVNMRSVYGWLDGKHIPSADSVVRVARGLDVSADWLLGLSSDRRPR